MFISGVTDRGLLCILGVGVAGLEGLVGCGVDAQENCGVLAVAVALLEERDDSHTPQTFSTGFAS